MISQDTSVPIAWFASPALFRFAKALAGITRLSQHLIRICSEPLGWPSCIYKRFVKRLSVDTSCRRCPMQPDNHGTPPEPLIATQNMYLQINNKSSALLRRLNSCPTCDDDGTFCGEDSEGPSPVYASEARLRHALDDLGTRQRVIRTPEKGYAASALVRTVVEQSTAASAKLLRLEAWSFVFHTFSRHPDAEHALYVKVERSQLPQAQHCVDFLGSLDAHHLTWDLSTRERHRIVKFCLSLSNFSPLEGKCRVVQLAEEVSSGLGDEPLFARLSLRERRLSRLFPKHAFEEQSAVQLDGIPMIPSTNALVGNQILLEAQELIDRDQLSLARSNLKEWQPVPNPSLVRSPSVDLQAAMQSQVTVLRAKICRYSGYFKLTATSIDELLSLPSTWTQPVEGLPQNGRVKVRCDTQDFRARNRQLEIAGAQIRFVEDFPRRKSAGEKWACMSTSCPDVSFSPQHRSNVGGEQAAHVIPRELSADGIASRQVAYRMNWRSLRTVKIPPGREKAKETRSSCHAAGTEMTQISPDAEDPRWSVPRILPLDVPDVTPCHLRLANQPAAGRERIPR
ncbi:hypothetical protein JHW43_009310 [Diplocarpon mali]|nr:hypothetical protein JHW43_009310 [Diplocarpon mali]